MKLHKRILNQDWAQAMVTWLLAAYLRFVRATGRWDVHGQEHIRTLADAGQGGVICFWHGRLIANMFLWFDDYPLHQLSTAHRDGKIAGKTYARFGIVPVWLQSNSPMEATRKLVKLLKSGKFCSITPDGPKGPRQRMPAATLDLARMSGTPIIPVVSSGTRMKVLNTWDRMQVPLPFARGAALIGEPINIPRDADKAQLEDLRQRIEDTLNAMLCELDAEFGQVTPDPAPLPDQQPVKGGA